MTADPSAALAAIRARVEAATPGPWSAANENGLLGPKATPAWCVSRMGEPTVERPDGWMYDIAEVYGRDRDHNPDAFFIAHARDDVPRMADALAAVLALHREDNELGPIGTCRECYGEDWPCPTIVAITDALGGAE